MQSGIEMLRDLFSSLRQQRWLCGFALLAAFVFVGCHSSPKKARASERPFVFRQDTFSFSNELVWRYIFDPVSGKVSHEDRDPPPTYSHHCFVVARAAKQFFQHAQFEPQQTRLDEAGYRKLIRKVASTSLARDTSERIIIPGYSNLFTFSQAQERLLKAECGGAWRSYFQKGHWRIMLPFTRKHQQSMAGQFAAAIRRNDPPVVHLVQFPELTINHAVVLFDLKEDPEKIEFSAYDPNSAGEPSILTFNRRTRTFQYPRNDYFIGGEVNVYEVYHRWNY